MIAIQMYSNIALMASSKTSINCNNNSPFGKLRFGTAGYDYSSWAGLFYRPGLARSEYLGAYSESFGCLELCFSKDHGPQKRDVLALLAKLRRPMDFTVRLGSSLSSVPAPGGWKAELSAIVKSLDTFMEKGCLFSVLACFPPSFRYGKAERIYLDDLLKSLAAFPVAVEFLNIEWLNARLIEGLKARGVCLCASDLPRMEGLPPPSDLLTADFAYVRFHGRNREAWLQGQGGHCGYQYNKDELAPWLDRLESLSLGAKGIRVIFCDKKDGAAPLSALSMSGLARAARLLDA